MKASVLISKRLNLKATSSSTCWNGNQVFSQNSLRSLSSPSSATSHLLKWALKWRWKEFTSSWGYQQRATMRTGWPWDAANWSPRMAHGCRTVATPSDTGLRRSSATARWSKHGDGKLDICLGQRRFIWSSGVCCWKVHQDSWRRRCFHLHLHLLGLFYRFSCVLCLLHHTLQTVG